MKRSFSLILCLALICSIGCFFVSCTEDGGEITESTTAPESMPETEPGSAGMKSISISDLSKFVIIRSDEDYLFEASAKILRDAVKASFSLDLDFKTDFVHLENAEEVLKQRYSSQLMIYALAIEEMTDRSVKDIYIYSFYLGRAVKLDLKKDFS